MSRSKGLPKNLSIDKKLFHILLTMQIFHSILNIWKKERIYHQILKESQIRKQSDLLTIIVLPLCCLDSTTIAKHLSRLASIPLCESMKLRNFSCLNVKRAFLLEFNFNRYLLIISKISCRSAPCMFSKVDFTTISST